MTSNNRDASVLTIFDLCDTLYAANTTVGFLSYYSNFQSSNALSLALDRWTRKASPFFALGAFAYRFAMWDLARERMVAALAGEPRPRLEDAAREYATSVLPPLANLPLHDCLTAHRNKGDRVVLVSSSLDLVVAPIAAALQTEYRASTLGFSGGICTGRIVRDLTGRKAAVVRELAGETRRYLSVYTDNRSDRDIIAMADHATIVIPHGRAEKRWGKSDCDIIQL